MGEGGMTSELFVLQQATGDTRGGSTNLIRHQAVQALLRYQQKNHGTGKIRQSMSLVVAQCFGKGVYFARKIVA